MDQKNLNIIQKAIQQSIDNVTSCEAFASNLNFGSFFARVWDHVPQMTQASRANVEKLIGEYTNPRSSLLIEAAAQIIVEKVDLLIKKLVDAGALRKEVLARFPTHPRRV
jgi:hypothetical protein